MTTAQERLAQRIGAAVVAFGALLGVYSYTAAAGLAPAAPWSPIGQHQQHPDDEQPTTPAPTNPGPATEGEDV